MTIYELLRYFPQRRTVETGEVTGDGCVRTEYVTKCPAHDDKTQSLDVKVKARILDDQIVGLQLHCHAGCTAKEIAQAMGIEEAPHSFTSKTILQFLENVKEYGSKGNAWKATCPICNDGKWGIVVYAKDGEIASPKNISTGGCKHTREEIFEEVRRRYEAFTEAIKPETAEQGTAVIASPAGVTVEMREQQGTMVQLLRQAGEQIKTLGEMAKIANEQTRALAEMLRVTNERMAEQGQRMAELEKAVRTLEKVTPSQAAQINGAMRERGAEICLAYRMTAKGRIVMPSGEVMPVADPEKVREMVAEIRKDVRNMTGVKTAREISRCDYVAVMAFIQGWEEFERIQAIRKKAKKREADEA